MVLITVENSESGKMFKVDVYKVLKVYLNTLKFDYKNLTHMTKNGLYISGSFTYFPYTFSNRILYRGISTSCEFLESRHYMQHVPY